MVLYINSVTRFNIGLSYLVLCFFGIIIYVTKQSPLVLYLAHLIMGVMLLSDSRFIFTICSKSASLRLVLLLSVLFFAWCIVIYLIYSHNLGPLRGIKPFVSNVVINFFLALYIGLSYVLQNAAARARSQRLYALVIILCIALVIHTLLTTPWFSAMPRLEFEEAFQNFYQTISSYLVRVSLVGIFMVILKPSVARNGYFAYGVFFATLVFSFFSFMCGGKKDPFLLLMLALVLLGSLWEKKIVLSVIVLLFTPFIFWMLQRGLDFKGMSFLLSELERSIGSRIILLQEEFSRQVEQSGYFGNPYVHDVFDAEYVHSFVVTLFTATGIIGTLLFSLMMIQLIICLVGRKHFNFCIILFIVIGLSSIATFFDWMINWFTLGLGASLLLTNYNGFEFRLGRLLSYGQSYTD